MADDLDQMPERAAAEKLSQAKQRIAVQRLRQQWARDGYNPRAHLEEVTGIGAPEVLTHFRWEEQRTSRSLASQLANWDCYEIESLLRYRRGATA